MDKVVITRKELIEKIIKDENLHPGDKISYDELVELAEKYSVTPYTLAVNILGATQSQFQAVSSKYYNAKNFVILKHLLPEFIENAKKLEETIRQNENLKEGSTINYNQLLFISSKYDIPERILAIEVLEISEYSYRKIKNKSSSNAIVFYNRIKTKKQYLEDDDKIISLRQEILRAEGLIIEDKINYEKLKQIAEKYKIDVSILGMKVLGISLNSFNHIKYDSNRNAIILKGYLNNEKLETLSLEIYAKENIEPYTKINYGNLQELSKKYAISEKILALNILGLTENQYWDIKYNKNTYAHALKNKYREYNLEELLNLREIIFENEKLFDGKRISYNDIEFIQKKYNIPLNELLYILGITKCSYNFIKREQYYCTIVKDMSKYFITQVLSEVMEKERYYSKDEIKDICKANNISLQDFFDYIMGKAFYFGCNNYEKVLNGKGKLWIGKKCKLSNEFIFQHLSEIKEIATRVSNYIYYKYKSEVRKLEKEDLEQEAFIIVIETCGDLEKNFDNEELFKMIYLRTRVNILKKIKNEPAKVSIYDYYKDRKEGKKDLIIKDENANTEQKALYNYEKEQEEFSILTYFSNLLERGYDKNISLEMTANVFGISTREILDKLKEEILSQGNIKETADGKYILTRKD